MDRFTPYGFPPPPLEEKLPKKLTGYFLAADADLADPNFSRSLVYIINHDDNGAMGLVVNRPSGTVLGTAVPEMEATPWREEILYIGGPVQQQFVFVLHTGLPDKSKSLAAVEALPGVVFEPDFSVVRPFLEKNLANNFFARFVVGYAGWGPRQLEQEIGRNDWIVLRGSAALVFSEDPAQVWQEALKRKGGIHWITAETGYKLSLN